MRRMKLIKGGCDLVIAVGGGSAIDIAKSINILSSQESRPIEYVQGKLRIKNKGKPFIAIPTTAGSGSEATHFAVIYVDGTKYSLSHDFILPEYAIIDGQLAMSMPKDVSAVTAMDAFSHAIESYWSINSTEESKLYSEKAIKLIVKNINESVNRPSLKSRKAIMEAAHLAGKAINIAKTTAPHALSYILTSNFGIPHGQAVALFLSPILGYNAGVSDGDCNDKRGAVYVLKTIQDLCLMLGRSTPDGAGRAVNDIMKEIGLKTDIKEFNIREKEIMEIVNNVNFERLSNNPRKLTSGNLIVMLKI